MRRISSALVVAAAATAGACSFNTPTRVSPATDLYSSYSGTLPISAALYVDAEAMSERVKPAGLTCSAHNYPVDARSAFTASVEATLANVVHEIETVDAPLNRRQLAQLGHDAMIVVRADDFDVDVLWRPGFWVGTAEAEADIRAGLQVDTADGRAVGLTVSGSGEADAPSGCPGGAPVIGDAVGDALEEVSRRLGETLSNARRLREPMNRQGT